MGEAETEQEARDKIKSMKIHKYIGETSRSGFERGWEHWQDLQELSSRSHMLKHIVNYHQEEDHDKIKFGMKVVAYTRTSFERQIREAVLIQQERNNNFIMNSKSEYNRSALPRITTQMGEQDIKEWEKKIRQEKQQEDETEAKIRTLRKKRNKDRVVAPQEPPSKRRKLETSYVGVKQAWGEPEKSEVRKTTRQDLEPSQQEQEHPPLQPPSKKSRQEKLTNIVTVENKIVQGPLEDLEWETKIDWEEHLRNHRQEIEKKVEEREKLIAKKEDKEKSWELYKLCKTFLEENSEDWEKNKMKRNAEKNRLDRLQLAKHKQKKVQINYIEKKIEEGLKRLPVEERKRLEEEEKKQEKLEIQKTKKELWKLRRKEKRITKDKIPESLKEIEKMTSKLEKITHVMKEVKRKEELEKERKRKQAEIDEKQRKIMNEKRKKRLQKEQEKKERLQKIEKIQERWALMRWITTFIDENSERWDKERAERLEKERQELNDWEKKNRFEKIRMLKQKLKDKKQKESEEMEIKQNSRTDTHNKNDINKTKNVHPNHRRSNTWSQWRNYKGKTRSNTILKTRNYTPPPIITRLKVKLLPPKLKLPDIDKKNDHNNKQEHKPEVAAPVITSTNNKQEIQPAAAITQNSSKEIDKINKHVRKPEVAAPTKLTPIINKQENQQEAATSSNNILTQINNKQETQPEAATSSNNINDILKPP